MLTASLKNNLYFISCYLPWIKLKYWLYALQRATIRPRAVSVIFRASFNFEYPCQNLWSVRFSFFSSSLLNIQVDSHCNLHSLSMMINLNSDCSNDICRSEIKPRHNKVWNQTSRKLTSFYYHHSRLIFAWQVLSKKVVELRKTCEQSEGKFSRDDA